MGIHSYLGETGTNVGPGLRIGSLLGGHLSPLFSLNAEITFDFLNVKILPAGYTVKEVDFVLAFSPLLHLPISMTMDVDFVIGPKLGIRGLAATSDTAVSSATFSGSGGVLGLNAGIFAAVSPNLAAGALLSVDVRSVSTTKSCISIGGGPSTCTTDESPNATSNKTIALNAGLMF